MEYCAAVKSQWQRQPGIRLTVTDAMWEGTRETKQQGLCSLTDVRCTVGDSSAVTGARDAATPGRESGETEPAGRSGIYVAWGGVSYTHSNTHAHTYTY